MLKYLVLAFALIIMPVAAQAQVVNLLTCTVQNTLTAEPAGANCAYGGVRQRCQGLVGAPVDTYFCSGGSVGELVDANGKVIPGSRSGRRHEPLNEDSGWDVLVWSAVDGAYWPVDPSTGTVWPEYGSSIANAQNVWHLGSDCTGPVYVVNGADNRVVWSSDGTAYKGGTETIAASSWSSCSVDTGWWCWTQTCPGSMRSAVMAESPPNLSGFTAPFQAAVH